MQLRSLSDLISQVACIVLCFRLALTLWTATRDKIRQLPLLYRKQVATYFFAMPSVVIRDVIALMEPWVRALLVC